MARAHLEYIQTQTVPWKQLGKDTQSRPGARVKPLSDDPDTKACTSILQYPAGWRMDRPHYLACDEEFYVLRGSFSVGGVTYRKGDYAYLPAGMSRPDMMSDEGADVLTFFEGPHASRTDTAPDDLYDPTKLIARIATEEMPWVPLSDPLLASLATDSGRKVLRLDPKTGERTWILKLGPDDPKTFTTMKTERHPVCEETFLIEGEISMQCGVQKPGAYFWRPEGLEHGPVGTLTGMLGFFRCKGGPLTTQWSEKAVPIQWERPYKPVLTPAAAAYAHNSYDPAQAY